MVSEVALEADSPVDDVVVHFTTGGRAWVQAKRSLSVSKTDEELASVVLQWRKALREGVLDKRRDRLVLAVAKETGPLNHLKKALERHGAPGSGAPSSDETEAYEKLEAHLGDLTAEERLLLSQTVVLLFPDVESVAGADAGVAQALMDGFVVPLCLGPRAWESLTSTAREKASRRLSGTVAQWVEWLRESDVPLVSDREGVVAARIEAAEQATRAYLAKVVARGSLLELIAVMDVPPLHVHDAALHLSGNSKELGDGLLLALLRRLGRVLLMGPPGGGKSTALRQVAAWYARAVEGPFPLYVPLPLLKPMAPEGLLEQVLKLAVSRYAREDADLVEEVARQRLREGRVALLFDGLDECLEPRKVLASLSEALAELHADVEIILATRDSVYRSARTLGFHEVHLKPPSNLPASLRDCAHQFALARGVPASEVAAWCELRLRWVAELREQDALLQETPLMGVLLVGIACEADSEGQLPRRRADVLSTVVERAAHRWELAHRRGEQASISTFTGTDAASILIAGFEEISHHAYAGGPVAHGVIIHALAHMLRSQWGLAPGQADSTAQQVLTFWAEAGAFVSDGADGQVRPRIRLLAELGEARYTLKRPAGVEPSWVEQRLASNDSEVLVLAAGLSPAVATTLIHVVARKPRPEWLRLAARAVEEGAAPTPEALELLVRFLRGQVTAGLPSAWPFAQALAQLSLPPSLHPFVLEVFERHLPEGHALCARALAFTNWEGVAQAPEVVWRDFLGSAPFRVVQETPRGSDIRSRLSAGAIDGVYTHAAARISRRLLEVGENGDAERVAKAAEVGAVGGRAKLIALLEQFGHHMLVEAIHKRWQATFTQIYEAIRAEAEAWTQYLQILAGLQPATATYGDRRRLESVVAFSRAIVPDEMPAGMFPEGLKKQEDVPGFLRTLAVLGGLDVGRLAGEAGALLEEPKALRQAICEGNGPAVEFRHWDRCEAPTVVRQSLIQWLSHSRWFAHRSVEALSHAPAPEENVEAVVRALPGAHALSRGFTVKLMVALSTHALPLLRHWGTHPDVLLRRSAAYALAAMWKRSEGLVPVQALRSSLLDEDVGVRKAAEGALSDTMRHEALAAIMKEAAVRLPTQWHCRCCGLTSYNVTAPACERCGAQDER
ncbi:hypothetical protein QEG98_34300 [Myxococcus sp. MxC21-1]|uniref:NACHT domain-containing protein n=1 Tax=Myxococcus sp. MxC21-1 TaxID=3041439 RepID=UPI00292DDCBC|nr:hypothetical protein [Myxococcus sp. MxC21-1]WNZ60946.1 hypothetical protein QEG98_34300 [Myxococcus sp. MxC21-1]